ncbi:MAG: hypothetical protein ACE5GD_05065 [Candidatus Geothermarchaeales archaeon]
MARYAFILSYEHPRLSEAEALASLEAEGVPPENSERIERALFIEADELDERVSAASHRSATIRLAFKILDRKRPASDPLSLNIGAFSGVLEASKTFGVRAFTYDSRVAEKTEKLRLERRLGELFLERFPHLTVDLTSPDVWVAALYVRDSLSTGTLLCDAGVKDFHSRRPRRRPSFTPATLHPKIARIMVNLSKVGRGEVLLDPFCGVGGILIEAGLIGARVTGFDILRRRALGAKKNLEWTGVEPLGVLRADAAKPPIKRVSVMVTDPPYGISASTAKRSYEEIYGSLLNYACEALPPGGRLVFFHPERFSLRVPIGLALKETHSFSIRVHGSLTRILRVFEKRPKPKI